MKYLLNLAWILMFVSCSNSAIDFNNKLTIANRSLRTFYDQVKEKIDEDSTEVVYLLADSLQKMTEKEIVNLQKLAAPKGGDTLKNACLQELNFLVSLCKNLKLEKGINSSKDERLSARSWIFEAQTTSDSLHEAMVRAQDNFRRLKKIKLEKE